MGQIWSVLGVLLMMQGFTLDAWVEPKERSWVSWNGMLRCQIESLFTPRTQDELVALVKEAGKRGKRIKVIGSGHSLSPIALPEAGEWVISLENYAEILGVDSERQTITVRGGATLKQVNEALDSHGLALENLGTISDQTVGGVFQTGTHGTGKAYGPLHTQIIELTLINGKGELKRVTPEGEPLLFRACQCGLGTLGIVETVTLRAVPAQPLCEEMGAVEWPEVLDRVKELVQANDHVRFHWFPYTQRVGMWTANPTREKQQESTKDAASFSRLIAEVAEERNDPQIRSIEDILELGPSDPAIVARFNRAFFEADYGKTSTRIDRSDQILNADCSAHSHCCAMETAFPIGHTKPFLLELQELVEKNDLPAHTSVEIRFVKADQALLSPTYSDHSDDLFCFVSIVSIHPNCRPVPYESYFQLFQELAERHQGRLHWGKMGRFDPAHLKQVYPRWEQFRELQKQEDPSGLFLNTFTRHILES